MSRFAVEVSLHWVAVTAYIVATVLFANAVIFGHAGRVRWARLARGSVAWTNTNPEPWPRPMLTYYTTTNVLTCPALSPQILASSCFLPSCGSSARRWTRATPGSGSSSVSRATIGANSAP